MEIKKLNKLDKEKPNELLTTFVMIKKIEQKEAKTGNPYIDAIITDGQQEMSAKLFDSTLADFEYEPGEVIKVQLKPNFYNNTMGANIKQHRKIKDSDGVAVDDFIKKPPVDVNVMYDECMQMIDNMDNADIAELVRKIYEVNKDKLLHHGAAVGIHHNIRGGLMWHSYRMAKSALALAPVYPIINKDIIVAGCLLHDVGKMIEMNTDAFGTSTFTVDGNLFGHLYLGVEYIRKIGEELGTDEEILRNIAHVVASHHGKLEYGTIAVPATLEAVIVHQIDMIDSRVYIFENELRQLNEGEFAENSNYVLEKARIYRTPLIGEFPDEH